MSLSLLAIICGYLLGSIPSGYFIARAVSGIDPRRSGDGNVGARNVYRLAGPAAGVATMFADMGKGIASILLAQWMGAPETGIWLAGFAATIGHDSMPLLGFHGGQGLAVIIGVCTVLLPREMIVVTAITLIVWGVSRNLDFGIGVGAVTLFALTWMEEQDPLLMLYLLALVPTIGIKKIMDLPMARRFAETHRRGRKR
ncbi:MAG: glycerol-3-phosphate acyltransferase [Chloroflexota bacterium]|nr:glycerol-3-phosphate acyltransferase [Chloroflexota bacterium]